VPPNAKRAHYVQGTHWDREWYEPFQFYRARLVRILDHLLDVLDRDEAFESFFFDGQTRLIEDYLALRPEAADRLGRHIRSGRIPVGPWYVMPDEFLPSGEALVRNLLAGCRESRDLGAEPMRVGYVCDIFGHNSQLPQILRGFGIDNAVLFRGATDGDNPARFRWLAPDGSQVMAIRLPERGGYGMCNALQEAAYRRGEPVDAEQGGDAFIELVNQERRDTGLDCILVLDAHDHTPPEESMVAVLERARRKAPDWEVLWSGLEAYAAEMRPLAAGWPERRGELRDPAVRPGPVLLANVLSSRIPLKQANVRCQVLLESWAEPLAVLAREAGYDGATPMIRLAWRYLLLNHPHDSICGSSLDQVHQDMVCRFDQSRLLAEVVRSEAGEAVAAQVSVERRDGDAVFLVWNPLPTDRDEVVDVDLPLPCGDGGATRLGTHDQQRFQTFELLAADGRPLQYQTLSVARPRRRAFANRRGYPCFELRRCVTVAARMKLPPCGYTTLLVRPLESARLPPAGSLSPGPGVMENERLRVDIQPNGTFDLADKQAGALYRGLGLLEDMADVGDGWNHFSPAADEVYTSLAAAPSLAKVADGPEKVTWRITHRLPLPMRFDAARGRRSTHRREVEVTTDLSLRRGGDTVECATRIDNTVRDHALRILLPTDLPVDDFLAETPYDVVRRPAALRDPVAMREPELEVKPAASFFGVHDGRRGLFVTTEGLHEAGLRDDERRSLLMTVCRAFPRNWNATILDQPGGELQQAYTVRWQIVPVAGEFDAAAIALKARALLAGTYVHVARRAAEGARLPTERSLMQLDEGRLTVTALKAADEGDRAILRAVNLGDRAARDRVRFARQVARFQPVTLEERPAGEWGRPDADGWIPLEAGPKEIVTVEVEWT
jgi:alpha-mannosidase/mannosylglycerate hydrolase